MLTNANFEVGFGMLPYWPDVAGAPRHPILGGGSLWVLARPAEHGICRRRQVLAYLSRPDVQAKWHQATGYLPITQAAYELTRKQGYYQNNPGADLSVRQITLNPPAPEMRGLRLAPTWRCATSSRTRWSRRSTARKARRRRSNRRSCAATRSCASSRQ